MSQPDETEVDSTMSDKQLASLGDVEGFFEKSKGRNFMFFQLFDGTICLKSREVPTDEGWEAEPVKTMNPQDKTEVFTYVKRFDRLIVRVVALDKRRKEFDKTGGKITNWNITVMAGNKRAILQTVWCDALLKKFLKVAPNINFDMPILFGAFIKVENGKKKQLISIRQGPVDVNPDDWAPVPFYWIRPLLSNKQPNYDVPATGADGTILPDAVDNYDEEEDKHEWDFKPQQKFLATHFKDNTLPKIQAIADALGIKPHDEANEGSTPEFTGGPVSNDPHADIANIPVVKKRPDSPASKSVGDAMTMDQAGAIRKLAKQIGKHVDVVAQKFVEEDFDDLSIEGASYVQYKLERRIAKAREEDPNAYPDPEADAKLKQAIDERKLQESQKAKQVEADDDDDFDDDDVPAPKAQTQPVDDDDDDDVAF